MDADARVEALSAQLDEARERIVQLEELLGWRWDAPLGWGLTGQEARLFGALLGRDLLSKDAGMAALYRDLGKDEPQAKILDVFVCKLRKKLKAFGIPVETVWGVGYRLSPEAKAHARLLLGQSSEGQAA